MFIRLLSTALAAITLTLAAAPASAQTPGAAQEQRDRAAVRETERVTGQTSRNITPGRRNGRRAAAPTAEQILETARAQAAIALPDCQVTNARLLGETPSNTSLYEVSCAAGVGSIIETKTPPTASDCIVLAVSAQTVRAADPAAEVGSQCELAGNTDVLGTISGYAKQASIPCTIDQATVRGADSAGLIIYEIGCQGLDGYWLKKAADGWSKTPCLQVLAENGTCPFTTPQEQAATIQAWLPDTNASDCVVGQSRLMGKNANGMFYEVTCTGEGSDGFILRTNTENVIQQVYACSIASQIGGGCKLTTTAPAAAAPETPPAA